MDKAFGSSDTSSRSSSRADTITNSSRVDLAKAGGNPIDTPSVLKARCQYES